MTVGDIAEWLKGDVVGDAACVIERVSKIEEADRASLTFLSNPRYEKFLDTTKASAVLVSRTQDLKRRRGATGPSFIRVDDPYSAFVRVMERLTPLVDPFPADRDASARVAPTARIGKNVVLGAHVVVDEGATIGDNSRISHGCVIGKNAAIGAECRLYPNVVVYHACKIGNRVTLHSGCVIGSDGFGFAPQSNGKYEKIPQAGIVVLEDDVEIGANSTVDRATLGETHIGKGVKIDNLVQVAHNVSIGDHTVIAAQTGISGSAKIGKHCRIAGQVGVNGHIEIADNTLLLGQTGVTKSITETGKMYFGTPHKEMMRYGRIEAALRSLPDLSVEFHRLKEEVAGLRERLAGSTKKR